MNQDQRLGSLVGFYKEYFGDKAETVWDCGTRDGHDAYYLASALDAETVIAIDANPIAAKQTVRNYPEFIVYNCGLSNYNGESEFTQIISDREDHAGSSSFVNFQNFPGATTNVIEVKVRRMDGIIKDEMPIGLDLMKVDLEGYTYEFLEGMGQYLSSVKVFHLETERFFRHNGHKNAEQVKMFMEGSHFKLVETSYEWGPHIEDQIWINTKLL